MKMSALVFTGDHLRLKYHFKGRISPLPVILKKLFTLNNNLAAKLQQQRWIKETQRQQNIARKLFSPSAPVARNSTKAMDHEEKQFPTSGIKQCSLLYC